MYGESCNIVGGYIYCIGGTDGTFGASDIYFAPVSSAGIGTWVYNLGYGPSYPTTIYDQSCVTYGGEYGYIYCVGGFDGIRDSPSSFLGTSSDVNYAQVTPNGVGDFSTPIVGSAGNYSFDYYPATVEDHSCVTSGGNIYCVGGFTVNKFTNSTGSTYYPGLLNAVYYAPLSSAGEGAWARASNYTTTIFSQSCATSGGTIYCVGGDTVATGSGPTGAVNYAPITSAGVGPWVASTSYPFFDEQQSCGISGGYIYCVGGISNGAAVNAVCYAQINNSTSGSATQAPSTCAAPRAASTTTSSASSSLLTTSSSGSSSTSTSSSLPLGYVGVVMIDVLVVLVLARLGFGRRPRIE